MKITCITPTCRKDALELNKQSLARQTFIEYEWIIVCPRDCIDDKNFPTNTVWLPEPKKNEGDFYNLNKAWNKAIQEAEGELIVSIVDLLWFPATTLETLWNHYVANPKACVGLTGNQYKEAVDGKPKTLVWKDPRIKDKSFYKIPPYDLELCIASLPKSGIVEVGGFDEKYDQFPAWSEKELACRMERNGYQCFIDETVQYRAIHHERLNEKWDELYPKSTACFLKDYEDIKNSTRNTLNYITH